MSEERKREEPILDVPRIYERLRKLYGVRTDVALADALSVPHGTLGTWRKRGSLPLSFIIDQSKSKNISIDYLLHGKEGRRTAIPSELDIDILAISIEKMLQSESIRGATLREAAQIIASLYRFSMELSLRLGLLRDADPAERARLLREEFGMPADDPEIQKNEKIAQDLKKLRPSRRKTTRRVFVEE